MLMLTAWSLGLTGNAQQRLDIFFNPKDCRNALHETRAIVSSFHQKVDIRLNVRRNEMDYMHQSLRRAGLLDYADVSVFYYTNDRSHEFGSASYFELYDDAEIQSSGRLSEVSRILPFLHNAGSKNNAQHIVQPSHADVSGEVVFSERVDLYAGDSSVLAVDYVTGIATELVCRGDQSIIAKRFDPDSISYSTMLSNLKAHGIMVPGDSQRSAGLPSISSAYWDVDGWKLCVDINVPRSQNGVTSLMPYQFFLSEQGMVNLLAWEDTTISSRFVRLVDKGFLRFRGDVGIILKPMTGNQGVPFVGVYSSRQNAYELTDQRPYLCFESDSVNIKTPTNEFIASDGHSLGTRDGSWVRDLEANACLPLKEILTRSGHAPTWVYDARSTPEGWVVAYSDGIMLRCAKIESSRTELAWATIADIELGKQTSCAQLLGNGRTVAGFTETTRHLSSYLLPW